MYTPEQIERFARRLRDRHAVEPEEVAGALDAYAATLRQAHAQGGVTEAMNWTEFRNRVSQSFSSKDVDEIHACYEAGKRAALSAEPAALTGEDSVLAAIDADPSGAALQFAEPPAAQGEAVNAPGYDVGWKIRGVTAYDEAKRKGYRHPECVEAAIKAAPPAQPAARVPDAKPYPKLGPEQEACDGYVHACGFADGWNACLAAMLASPAPSEGGKGVEGVVVTAQGVRFGENCWYSHERITGKTADELNSRKAGMTANAYMDWVQETLAAQQAAR